MGVCYPDMSDFRLESHFEVDFGDLVYAEGQSGIKAARTDRQANCVGAAGLFLADRTDEITHVFVEDLIDHGLHFGVGSYDDMTATFNVYEMYKRGINTRSFAIAKPLIPRFGLLRRAVTNACVASSQVFPRTSVQGDRAISFVDVSQAHPFLKTVVKSEPPVRTWADVQQIVKRYAHKKTML